MIALVAVLRGSRAVLDDREARACAQAIGIPLVGTLGRILRAKRAGVLQEARPVVERLLKVGAYLAPALVDEALGEVGE